MADPVDLYQKVKPPGENIPLSVDPLQLEDLVHIEDEIDWVERPL